MHADVERALAASFWSKLPCAPVEPMLADGMLGVATAGQIVTEAQAHDQVAIVLSGLFRMFARAKSGRQVTVAYAREGDTIGLVSALAGPCHSDHGLLAPVSQQELANAVGTVREVVSRVCSTRRSSGSRARSRTR